MKNKQKKSIKNTYWCKLNKGLYIENNNFIFIAFLEEIELNNMSFNNTLSVDELYKYSPKYIYELIKENSLFINNNNKTFLIKNPNSYFMKIEYNRIRYINSENLQQEDFYMGFDVLVYKQNIRIDSTTQVRNVNGLIRRAEKVTTKKCKLEFKYNVTTPTSSCYYLTFIPEYGPTTIEDNNIILRTTHINDIPIEEFFKQICEEEQKGKENECK